MKTLIYTLSIAAALTLASCGASTDKQREADKTELEQLQKAKQEAEEAEMKARAAQAEAKAEQRRAEFEAKKAENAAKQTARSKRHLEGPVQYSGKIGGKYAVVMDLDLSIEHGSYYYTKYGPSNRMTLYIDSFNPSTGRITMSEFNPDGEYCGEFHGHVDGNAFTGTMTNFRGQKFSFTLNAR